MNRPRTRRGRATRLRSDSQHELCQTTESRIAVSEYFGELDPRRMPPHFFWGAVRLDCDSAEKADVSKQNYTTCPRYWYVDATFICPRCNSEFCFSADEQRHWFEELGFYVDSLAKHCINCRKALRAMKQCRKEYDRDIDKAMRSNDTVVQQRMVIVIDELCEYADELPQKILEQRRILGCWIAERGADG